MARPRNLSTDDLSLFRRRATARTGLAIAVTVGLALACVPDGLFVPDVLVLLVHGVALYVYGPMLRGAGPARHRLASGLVLGLLGGFLPFWVIAASWQFMPALPSELAGAVSAGLLFTVLLTLDFTTWRAFVIMVLATALAVCAAWMTVRWAPTPGWRPHHLSVPALFLHLGIALTLFDAARRSWPKLPGLCAVCGYSLAGLPGGRCPECGAAVALTPARAGASASA